MKSLSIGWVPHKGTQKLLKELSRYLAECPYQIEVFHTGDIDYGGIRIYEYLRCHFFKDLRPYLMDVATYEANLDLGTGFSLDYAKQLAALLQRVEYMGWKSLIESMLKHGKRLEQEAILLRYLSREHVATR
jgi:DNA topoisomerase VI subunit A